MNNEEVMNLLTDMGLHAGGMENWIPDNAWVRVVNKVIEIEREKSDRRMVRQRNNFGKVLLKAVADEREACAKVCDDIMQFYKTNTTMNTDQNLIGYMAAELCGVRIRGKQ